MKRCCLCGKPISDYGHNPWPLKTDIEDRCCEDCNSTKVIPARIEHLMNKKKENNGKCK